MTEPLVIGEVDDKPSRLECDDTTATALARTKLVLVSPAGAGAWDVLPNGRVGAAQIGEVSVSVTPKGAVPISRLMFLLGYARDPGFQEGTWARAEGAPDLLSALAESLVRHAERALRLGPLQGYVTVSDSMTTLRGRIDIAEQVRSRPGMSYPIAVTFDDYTHDIAENRVLRTAVYRALAFPRLSSTLRARLRHVLGKLEGASLIGPGAPLPRWHASRLNARYQDALHFAEMILLHGSFETAPEGGVAVAAFSVDMAKVFEDFVEVAVREACRGRSDSVVGQRSDWLDLGTSVRIRPDVTFLEGRHVVGVLDAKYKSSVDAGARNADAYQMLAYCTALGIREAWLVHASAGREAGPREPIRVRGTDVVIQQWGLDLSVDPQAILGRIAALAVAVESSRERVP